MSESTRKVTRVCRCQHCGNEAEMMVTCTLEDVDAAAETRDGRLSASGEKAADGKVKGSATCSHCGNEADMWIDL